MRFETLQAILQGLQHWLVAFLAGMCVAAAIKVPWRVRNRVRLRLMVGPDYADGGPTEMDITVRKGRRVLVGVSGQTASGRQAALDEQDNPVSWTSSDEAITKAAVIEGDRTKAYIRGIDIGTADIVTKADADRDAGEVREVSAIWHVTVLPLEADELVGGILAPEEDDPEAV